MIRRIFGGNSDEMINFTRMNISMGFESWDTMEANTLVSNEKFK